MFASRFMFPVMAILVAIAPSMQALGVRRVGPDVEVALEQRPRSDTPERIDDFLLTHQPTELHARGGVPPYTAQNKCSIDEATVIVDYASTQGVTLTAEQVQTASPFFRAHDSTADRFRVTTNIIPIVVGALALHFARGCLYSMALDGALHLAHHFSDGSFGVETTGWGYLRSCLIGGLTGGFSAFARGKLIATELGPTASTAFKNSLRTSYKIDRGDIVEETVSRVVESSVTNAFDTNAVDSCAAFARDFGITGSTVSSLETWSNDCAGQKLAAQHGADFSTYDAAMGSETLTADPVVPLMLYATGTSTTETLFPPSGATVRIKYSFVATQAGTVTIQLIAANEGTSYVVRSDSVAIDSSLLRAELEGTFDIPSQDFANLNTGTDPQFRLFLGLQHSGGFSTQYETPRGGGFPIFLKSRNLPVVLRSAATPSGSSVTFTGSYEDPEGASPTSLELVISGPSSLTIDLLPSLAPGAIRTWSALAFLSSGIYQYQVRAVEGGRTYTSAFEPLRVSATPPVVTLSLDRQVASIGDTISGTVDVTDANGGLPGVEVALSCNGRGPFRDAAGNMVRKVLTNSAGHATFSYEVTTSGDQTILAMEPSHEYALADFTIEGTDSDVYTEFTWSRDASRSTDDVAVYDVTIYIEYPRGTKLEPSDYVYFSANHGTFQYPRDQTGTSSIVHNVYTLTSAEAASGSEVITLSIPEYGVQATHVVDLPVGQGTRLTRSRQLAIAANTDYNSFGVDISPDGQFIAHVNDQTVTISRFYATSGGASFTVPDPALCVRFSPDSTRLAVGDDDGGVTIYDIATAAKTFKVLTGSSRMGVTNIHWLTNDILVMTTQGTNVDPPYSSRVLHVYDDLSIFNTTYLTGVGGYDMVKITCSASSNLCAAASDNARWSLIDAYGGEIASFLHPDNDDLPALAFSSDGTRLIVGGYDDNVTDVAYLKLFSVSGYGASPLSPPLSGNVDVLGAAFFHDGVAERLVLAGSQYTEVFHDFSSFPALVGDPHSSLESIHFRMTPDRELVLITNNDQWVYNFSDDQQGPGLSIVDDGPVPYSESTFTLRGTVSDASPIATAEYSRGTWVPLPLVDGTFAIDITGLVVGSNIVQIRLTDRFGNITTAAVDVVRLDDVTAPAITAAAATPSDAIIGTTITLSCHATDDDAGVASVTATVRNSEGVVQATGAMTANGDSYSIPVATTAWAPGVYTVDYTAVDTSTHANTRTVTTATTFRLKVPLGNPSNLQATAVNAAQVTVTWTAAGGAARYQVFRSASGAGEQLVATPTAPPWNDFAVASALTYVYRVRAVADDGRISSFSNREAATTVVFTNDPLVPGSTIVRALHWTELRTAIDRVRAAAGLVPATYSRTVSAGSIIRATDLAEMRNALDVARGALLVPPIAYGYPATSGRAIRAVDLQELRNGVK